ncbi:hypothetical protein E4T56_gene5589 [Termitomyces sp. T112]|nr:hypothetical protein E4T56_gene5589 [Termitomyces sp. T112]
MAVASSDVESNAEEDQEELVNDEEAPPEVEEPEGDDNAKSVQIDGDEYIAVDVYDNKYYVSGSADPGGSAALGESLLGGHDPLALATGHLRAFWALIACADSSADLGGSAALGKSLLGGRDPLALVTKHLKTFRALMACADSQWDVIQTDPGSVTTHSPKPHTSSIKPPNPQKDPQRSAELPPMPRAYFG